MPDIFDQIDAVFRRNKSPLLEQFEDEMWRIENPSKVERIIVSPSIYIRMQHAFYKKEFDGMQTQMYFSTYEDNIGHVDMPIEVEPDIQGWFIEYK